MNALKDRTRKLVNAAMGTKSGPKRLFNFDPNAPGRRLFPADNHKKNEEFEVRLDAGEPRKDNPDLVAVNLQLNREAKTKGLKDLVKANGTHHTYATAWVNVKEEATEEVADKLVDDLFKDMD